MFNFKHSLMCISLVVLAAAAGQGSTIDIGSVGLWAGGKIDLGGGVSVSGIAASGGAFSASSGTNLTSIYTEKGVWIDKGSVVSGDVIANGKIETGSNVKIGGTVSAYSDFVLPKLDILEKTTFGTKDVYGKKDSTTTLLAGDYKGLSFSKDTTLNLSSGKYNIQSFWMDKDSVVNVNTSAGDVVLNIAGSFSTSRNVSFANTGSGSLQINIFGKDFWLGSDSSLSAVLKVFGGNIGADSSVNLSGQMYATGNIWLGNNSQFEYTPAIATAIPEPSTLALLAVAGFYGFIAKGRHPKHT
ncbi:MAG: PEP-CTERM sorting domain-containing protein [Phycisphaerae bacterium]|jgi:hypothetical protein